MSKLLLSFTVGIFGQTVSAVLMIIALAATITSIVLGAYGYKGNAIVGSKAWILSVVAGEIGKSLIGIGLAGRSGVGLCRDNNEHEPIGEIGIRDIWIG